VLHAYLAKELAPLLASSPSSNEGAQGDLARAVREVSDTAVNSAPAVAKLVLGQVAAAGDIEDNGDSGLFLAAAARAAFAVALHQQQRSVKSVVRLLGRMALAHAYLKEIGQAKNAYALGESLATVAGDSHVAGVYHRDRQQLAGK
jgi:hypothetical protein